MLKFPEKFKRKKKKVPKLLITNCKVVAYSVPARIRLIPKKMRNKNNNNKKKKKKKKKKAKK